MENLKKKFKSRYGNNPILISAPGRINLIGEHTDYNQGLALPAAIGRRMTLAIAPSGSRRCRIFADGYGQAEFSLDELKPVPGWMGYVMGVAAGIVRQGLKIGGFDLMVESGIPVGAGLSSSAALCCGLCFGLSEIFGLKMHRKEMALVAQYAEHQFAGVRCGLMDQYASLFGKGGSALFLDFRDLDFKIVPLQLGERVIMLVNSGVSHELAGTAYNKRRESCELGVKLISERYPVQSLREVGLDMLDEFRPKAGEEVYKRCRYVVEEIERVKQAVVFLDEGDYRSFGELLYSTHRGLSEDYEVGCSETDFLVEAAAESGLVHGARMMGGGFGGCTLNILEGSNTDAFREIVQEKYLARFGKEPDFYQVAPAEGVFMML
ncbi:MAG: galactokinase [Bacteroidetes bacterium]|nr:galactokinase [Bacteroidota bacterium]